MRKEYNRPIHCFACGQIGHITRNCPRLMKINMLEEENNKPELLRYFGCVNGSRCTMTLDTGAQVSVMSLDYAKKLGHLLVPADGKFK